MYIQFLQLTIKTFFHSGDPNHFKETFILSLFSNYISTTDDITEQKLIYIYIYRYLCRNGSTICQHSSTSGTSV